MGINWDGIKLFEFTKTFKEEVMRFTQNNSSLKIKINDCIKDFQSKKFNSKYYRKPLKNWKYSNLEIHELQIWWDYRIIIQIKIEKNICYLINFWNHSYLNLSSNKTLKINPIK